MQHDFSDQQTCPVCEGDDVVVDESETRPIVGQWYGRVISWARFLCRACDAATLEYDEHEGYQTVWPYDDQILDRNDQIAAEEAIIAALFDLFDRPGHRLELGEELCRRASKRILFAVLPSCPSLVAAQGAGQWPI